MCQDQYMYLIWRQTPIYIFLIMSQWQWGLNSILQYSLSQAQSKQGNRNVWQLSSKYGSIPSLMYSGPAMGTRADGSCQTRFRAERRPLLFTAQPASLREAVGPGRQGSWTKLLPQNSSLLPLSLWGSYLEFTEWSHQNLQCVCVPAALGGLSSPEHSANPYRLPVWEDCTGALDIKEGR